ncbi:MAG TPA: YgeY family selenium metabolism-linked hydrolase [Desulfobacteraceae bacterium]|nr:YgeY family selenium metabolism-linked hydrolase [Desulfobacteraceae bacterium]
MKNAVKDIEADLIAFTRELVRTRSYTGEEEKIIRLLQEKMTALGYEDIRVDDMGNLVGRIGHGGKTILFDSHVDTVAVSDASLWRHDPFGAIIEDGRLYGRGAVDMKSAAAASVYAGALAGKLGLAENKTILVSCTVMEEDCDGENLKHMFKQTGIIPDYAVICEPSDNRLVTGHKGKAQISVKTKGVSAHGSAPEKGSNAIYEMADIIRRIDSTAGGLTAAGGTAGTLVASRISSTSESLNAVPFGCEIYLDRRLTVGETLETVQQEMDAIIEGKKASWEIGVLHRKSWTGLDVSYHPFHPAWEIEKDHPLFIACAKVIEAYTGAAPELDYWDFSTNAVTTTAMGIPTIGLGPGEYKLAHMVNENCRVSQIVDACALRTGIMEVL